MKKLFIALIAAVLLAPAVLSAQQTTTRTWFEGERITGVAASSGFQVTLVNSDRPRAVVEIDRDLEEFVRIENDGGIVSIGIRIMNNREKREFDRLFNSRRSITKKMTLYLPTLNTIRLSSSSSLSTSDSFPGRDLDILTSGSGAIRGELRVSSERVKLQCSSSSRVENLILGATRDLTAVLSGSARATIVAPKTVYSRLSLSSAASLRIADVSGECNWSTSGSARLVANRVSATRQNITTTSGSSMQLDGNGDEGVWATSGSSRIVAEEFTVKKLTVTTSTGSSIRANVVAGGEQLVANLSGSSNVSITASGVGMSRFVLSSGSSLRISGNGDRGDWMTSGSARIVAEEFALRDLSVTASSGSSARVNVSGTLTTQTSGSAAVRYAGNPARINDTSSGVRPL